MAVSSAPPRRGPLGTDPSLEVLWNHVLDHWEDERAHAAFLRHSDELNQLADAATRYRGMTGDHARAALADKKLKAVAVLAMAKLETQRSQPPSTPRLLLTLAALFLVGTAAFVALYVSGAL